MNRRGVPVIFLLALVLGAIVCALILTPLSEWTPPPSIELPPGARVLFLLPHPDDEILSAGGVISELVQRKCQLTFVYLTNGENFEWAAEEESQDLLLSPQEYIKFGYERQKETESALKILGVAEPRVIFLGYPDGKLSSLLRENWSYQNPLFCRQLNSSSTPYSNSFNPQATFCGLSLLEDLKSAILKENWDLVFLPSPYDSHPDHWAAAAFTRLALEELRVEKGFSPVLVSYLVHRGSWPGQRGKEKGPLAPPVPLWWNGDRWVSFPLSPEIQALKEKAVREYKSQLKILSGYLFSFLRPNELFTLDKEMVLSNEVKVFEPVGDTFWRNLLRGADFSSISFFWDEGLRLSVETAGSFPKSFRLDIHIISTSGGIRETLFITDAFRSLKGMGGEIQRKGKMIYIFLPMKKPQAFLLSMSSRYWENIDRSAYWLIRVP
jgi:LmbE family N-acetylglucosaminyl deacetylase